VLQPLGRDAHPPATEVCERRFADPVHLGTGDQANAEIAPLRALGPAVDLVGPMPCLALQSMIDHDNRARLGHYSKSHWLRGYPDQLIDTLIDALPAAPSPLAHLITARMGGAIQRVPVRATPFAHRMASSFLWIINYWGDPETDDAQHRRWVNDVLEATRAYCTGAWAMSTQLPRTAARRACAPAYDEETVSCLRQIKRDWDPDNTFRLNANIPPA
jgi:hypothetical protein